MAFILNVSKTMLSRTTPIIRFNSTYSLDPNITQSIHKGGISRSFTMISKPSELNPSPHWHRVKGAPFVVGVAGGTASGKTEVVKQIVESLPSVAVIPQDSFYKSLSEAEKALANRSQFNFDHPFAFDFDLLKKLLISLKQGEQRIRVPTYDYVNHGVFPADHDTIIESPSIVILEGILALYDPIIRDLLDMKVFVDADADTRLIRRVRRDLTERGRNLDKTLQQYETFVKPSFDAFCLPQRAYADVIMPRGVENTVAIDLITMNLRALQKQCEEERGGV